MPEPATPPPPRMPRWVKVFLVVGAVIALLAGVALLTGHGPGRHFNHGAPVGASVR